MSKGKPGGYEPGFYDEGLPWRSPGGPPAPVPYDPESQWKNDTYSVPGKVKSELRGHWAARERGLSWRTPVSPEPNVVATAGFGSPIFDLRPDLGSSHSFLPDAQPIRRSSAYGAGARLLFQFSHLPSIAAIPEDLRVFYVESAHVNDPNAVRAIMQDQEITESFFDGGISTVLEWSPPGNPIRYWRCTVFFWLLNTKGAAGPNDGPNITVAGALY